MRSVLTRALALCGLCALSLSYGHAQQQKSLPAIKSGVERITYQVDKEKRASWTITPEAKPDRLEVECKTKKTAVAFITDVDSIKFSVKEGDTLRFLVLHEGKEALTEIVGVPKNVNFTKEYIRRHQGKSLIEVPEVHELANILVALSRVGRLDSNMVDMTTPYYKEVMAHFAPYKHHAILDTINRHIVKPLDNKSYWYYYAMKMNACAYVFDKQGAIVNEGIIRKMGFGNEEDPIRRNAALLADFAKKSGFREFYRKHQPYYNQLIKTYKKLNPMEQMQSWLENKFPLSYGSYRVTFSPLVGGAHATQRFEDNGFSQTFMFQCRVEASEKYSKAVNEMLASKTVFTEIDHNFVNPISDQYAKQIAAAFSDRQKWVNEQRSGTSAYPSPYSIFNEYMTWSVFSLYCQDHFPAAEVATFIPMMVKQMEEKRGFIKFGDFNNKLLELYKANPNKKVNELYAEMLVWSAAEQNNL